MERQITLWDKPVLPADIVYTPTNVSKGIIDYLNPTGLLCDPCRGDGSFYNSFPDNTGGGKYYCEISEGKDFFDFNTKVDWIIGNPPYSIFKEFLEKSFELAENVSFLVPTNKVFQRQIIMDMINKYGGIKSMIVYGSGSLIGFPFGFSVGNFHFKKDYKGPCNILIGMKSISNIHPLIPQ